MEAILLRGCSLDHKPAGSPHKSYIRPNPNNNKNYNSDHNPFISPTKHINHILPPSQYFHSMGFSQPLPHYNNILSNSSYPPPYTHQQPPLLPLPAATISRGPPNKKPNNRKKSKSTTNSKNQRKTTSPKKPTSCDDIITVSSSRVIPSATDQSGISVDTNSLLHIKGCAKAADDGDKYGVFSGSVIFALSPPPSSLPLPSFSLRPKLISCKAEVTGADGGASGDLRRLLQLR